MATGTDQALNTPTVVVTGASSQIGVFAIPKLVKAGYRVLALSRKGKPDSWPSFARVQWLQIAELQKLKADYEFLLSAGPMQLGLEVLKTGSRVRSAVVFGSSSVHSKLDSNDPREREQVRNMMSMQSEMHKLAGERDINLCILKPTLIYGCGLDRNITRLAEWIERFGFLPVNGRAKGLRQPVHAKDLAAAAVAALGCRETLPLEMFLAGGETISYNEMTRRIFRSLGKSERLLYLPQWLLVSMVQVANLVRPATGINTEMVKRQRQDLVFDDQQARELLAYRPRPFAPEQGDFSLPFFG